MNLHGWSLPVTGPRVQYSVVGNAAELWTTGYTKNMQLPDESIAYQYQSLLAPAGEEWTPLAELQGRHFLPAARLRDLVPRLQQVRSQVATERDLQQVPPELQPLDAGFVDLPQKTLDEHRRKTDVSVLGRVLHLAERLRNQVD